MKYIATGSVEWHGTIFRGDTVELDERTVAAEPRLKANLRPLGAAAAEERAELPLLDGDGNALPGNAQMTRAQLEERLYSMGVRGLSGMTKSQLFGTLKKMEEPEKSRG